MAIPYMRLLFQIYYVLIKLVVHVNQQSLVLLVLFSESPEQIENADLYLSRATTQKCFEILHMLTTIMKCGLFYESAKAFPWSFPLRKK